MCTENESICNNAAGVRELFGSVMQQRNLSGRTEQQRADRVRDLIREFVSADIIGLNPGGCYYLKPSVGRFYPTRRS